MVQCISDLLSSQLPYSNSCRDISHLISQSFILICEDQELGNGNGIVVGEERLIYCLSFMLYLPKSNNLPISGVNFFLSRLLGQLGMKFKFLEDFVLL